MKKIPWWYTEISSEEKQEVLSAFESRSFSLGPKTKELETRVAKALNVPYSLVTSSGTAAITMALMSINIKPGDEVIVPDLTWIATANAVAILGARVILADCLPYLPLIDPKEVKRKITSRTKAIIPVHMNGRSCQMEELLKIAKENGIFLIEDACKAFASKYGKDYLGTLGSLGCYSLGMVSLVSTCYGGAVVTKDRDIYEKLKIIRNQGVALVGDEKYLMSGFNFKFSDILASIGIAQMRRIKEKLSHLEAVYKCYLKGVSDLPYLKIIPVDIASGEVPLLVEAKSKYAKEIINYLAQQGVEALRSHLPLHKALYLGNHSDFSNASAFSEECLILPSGPSQPLKNVGRCIKLLQGWKPQRQRK